MLPVGQQTPTAPAEREVARTFLAVGDWSVLVAALKRAGFAITLDREMRLAALLWRLTRARVSLEKSGDAIGYLAPVLCVTADDRIRFEEIVNAHYQRRAAPGAPAAARERDAPDPTRLDPR